jgi:hypothetical protein
MDTCTRLDTSAALDIADLDFEVMPGGSSEPVLHWPAARVVIAVIAAVYSSSAE